MFAFFDDSDANRTRRFIAFLSLASYFVYDLGLSIKISSFGPFAFSSGPLVVESSVISLFIFVLLICLLLRFLLGMWSVFLVGAHERKQIDDWVRLTEAWMATVQSATLELEELRRNAYEFTDALKDWEAKLSQFRSELSSRFDDMNFEGPDERQKGAEHLKNLADGRMLSEIHDLFNEQVDAMRHHFNSLQLPQYTDGFSKAIDGILGENRIRRFDAFGVVGLVTLCVGAVGLVFCYLNFAFSDTGPILP